MIIRIIVKPYRNEHVHFKITKPIEMNNLIRVRVVG